MNTTRAGRSQYLRKEMNPHKGQVYNFRSYFRKTNQNTTVFISPHPQGLHLSPHELASGTTEPRAHCCPRWSQQNCKENSARKEAQGVWNLQKGQDLAGYFSRDEWQCAQEKRRRLGNQGEKGEVGRIQVSEVHVARPRRPSQDFSLLHVIVTPVPLPRPY